MFRKLSVALCGLGVVLLTAGAATAQSATQDTKAKTKSTASHAKASSKSAANKTTELIDDAAITTAVKTKLLADSKVGGLKIDVDTSNGVVTLTGPVNSSAERAQALKLARGTKGVTRVVSKLTLEPKAKTKTK
jgi:osmotically-inducible protein OsmY